MTSETSQTLDRGLQVLTVLSHTPRGMTVTELARVLEVNRTVVYRLVSTLHQRGLVRRDGRGRLHVGMAMLDLASSVQPQVRAAATPVLRELAETIGCTAHLTVADGDEALALAVAEPSWTTFHVAYRVGTRHPISAGAAGRAMGLTSEPDAPAYVISNGELQQGAQGLAAPVLGVAGLRASVGILFLGEDVDEKLASPRVVDAASQVAHQLR